MNSPLPPDPYKTLGVAQDAKLPEIRSAHRKLVLKCHPDKVQDAALKTVKQDEFQKVQQAYEILSDDTKRSQYDNEARLYEVRKAMSRGKPTPRSNPFEYEVKTAEPRANSFARAGPKVYTHPTAVPRSYEDLYEEPVRHTPKKSSSYESATDRDRKRPPREDARAREDLLRKLVEEERIREERLREDRLREDRLRDDRIREEKLREKDRRDRTHTEKKKSRDKDRKGRGEEKTRTRQPFFEDDSSDEESYRAARAAKKEEKRRAEEDLRLQQEHAAMRAHAAAENARAEAARVAAAAQRAQIKEAPMTPKWSEHKEFAGAYMMAARRKAAPEPEDDRHPHPTPPSLRRAETFNPQTHQYQVHYATQQYSDDDTPRRSSGYKETRRTSDTPSSKKEKPRRRSPEHPQDPYIVEPASPQLPPKKPTLKTYQSEPPLAASRNEPNRSRTQDYPRVDPIPPPPMPRAQTFNNGDTRDRGRDRGASKLKYASAESDSDPSFGSPRLSHSPHRMAPEPTVYRVQDSRVHPVPPRSHRSDLHNLNEPSYARERSISPRGTPHRPVLTRNTPSGDYYTSPGHYAVPEAPPTKPIIMNARPKVPREGSSRSHGHRSSPNATYDSVKYAPTYDASQVKYADYPNFYESKRPSDHYGPRRGQELYT
jgi:curved DNA-binding protein CbpA